MSNTKESIRMIRLPSVDGRGECDRFVVIPAEMRVHTALQQINDIIHAVNLEDHQNDGACLDGMTVEDNIERRLTAKGFIFNRPIMTSIEWDAYDPDYVGDRQNVEPIPTEIEYSREEIGRNRRFRQVTKSGVVYDGELAGPGGMSYVLLREPHTTDQLLKEAVAQLRANQDVVGSIKVTAVIPYGTDSMGFQKIGESSDGWHIQFDTPVSEVTFRQACGLAIDLAKKECGKENAVAINFMAQGILMQVVETDDVDTQYALWARRCVEDAGQEEAATDRPRG